MSTRKNKNHGYNLADKNLKAMFQARKMQFVSTKVINKPDRTIAYRTVNVVATKN